MTHFVILTVSSVLAVIALVGYAMNPTSNPMQSTQSSGDAVCVRGLLFFYKKYPGIHLRGFPHHA